MPLPEPVFDRRTYREILGEAMSRVPVHTPEWTNFNEADPGVTLVELFAFMTESLIYRANLIPERNRQKFLRLLGLPVRAASAARGLVVFENPRGSLATVTLDRELALQAGKVPFSTENGLDVLPVEARVYTKRPLSEPRRAEVEVLYRRLYASVANSEERLEFYDTARYETPASGDTLSVLDLATDTVDGSIWVALLARDKDDPDVIRHEIADKVLNLGIVPALAGAGCTVYPVGPPASGARPTLLFEIPNTTLQRPRYRRLSPTFDDDPLQRPTLVSLRLPGADQLSTWDDLPEIEAGVGDFPPNLEDTRDGERVITWIRIRSPEVGFQPTPDPDDPEAAVSSAPSSQQVTVQISWVGINAARVVQQRHVAGELLPRGTGEPDQRARLANTPVVDSTLALTINGEAWSQVDDLMAAPPEVPPRSCHTDLVVKGAGACAALPTLSPAGSLTEVAASSPKVYALDIESGEIRFGDGAHGMRPPRGAIVQASYDFGGGLEGMVGIGSIRKGSGLPPGVKVGNPVPTWGGDAAESTEDAERAVPATLRHRDRLISTQDFEEITWRTPGVDLGRVEVLPLVHPRLPGQSAQGVVSVVVIPARDSAHPDAPRPDALFLATICEHLEPRRVITTELHVLGPSYRGVWVTVGIEAVPSRAEGPVREAVEAEIRRFLSPLRGGFEQSGWPLGKAVEALELWAAATRVSGVAKVNLLRLGSVDGAEVDRVELGPLDLPELLGVAAQSGDAPTLDEVLGAVEVLPETVEPRVPVPVVPEEC